MFNKVKLEKLAALKGVEAENITAEQLQEVNSELASAGLEHLQVSLKDDNAETFTQEDIDKAVEAKESELNDNHAKEIQEKDEAIEGHEQKIEELEKLAIGDQEQKKVKDNAQADNSKKSLNDQFKEQAQSQARDLASRANKYNTEGH